MKIVKKTLCIDVMNEHGILARICSLFAARGYNIDSLSVATLGDERLSRISLCVQGDAKTIEQIIKQTHKLIPVLSVIESDELIIQESVLIKFENNEKIGAISALINNFGGKMLACGKKNIVFSFMCESTKVGEYLLALSVFKPKEVVRSGVVGIERN